MEFNQISGQKLKGIAQLTRWIEKKELKNYLVKNWQKVKDHNDEWADKFLDALAQEDFEEVKKLLRLR